NNKGLQLRHAELQGLGPMLQGKLYSPTNKTTQQNVQGMMRLMNLDPKSFEAWKSLIKRFLSNFDYVSMTLASQEALSIKDDDQIRQFVKLIPHPIIEPLLPAQEVSKNLEPGAAYINSVSAAIKKIWSPPATKTSARVVVEFEVDVAGKVSKLKDVQPGTV